MRFWRGIAAAAAGLALVLAPVLAQATGPGGTVSNVVAVWGQDTGTGLPCIVAPIGGSATCVLPTTSGGGGGGGGTSSNFAAAFPTAGTAAGFKSSSGSTMQPGNLDSGGNILVDVAAGSSGNAAASATGSAVPTDSGYTGLNSAGSLIGWIGDSSGRGVIVGAGVAGTPTGGVGSIQGVSGGTAVPVSMASGAVASGAYASGSIAAGAMVDIGTGGSPAANTVNSRLATINTTLGTPMQATGGTVGLVAGSAKVGQFAVDQTTPGTTNAVQDTAGATGGATPVSVISANSTNATVVKASAGTLYHDSLQNSSTTALAYIIFFNTTTTPTCTASPAYGPILIPYVGSTGNNGSGEIEDIAVGLNFTTGISYCITTAPGGTGSVAANAITGGLGYK